MAAYLNIFAWTSVTFDVAVAIVVLLIGLRRLKPTTHPIRIIGAALAAGMAAAISCIVKAVIVAGMGGGSFSVIYLAYLAIAFTPPIVALIVLWRAYTHHVGWARHIPAMLSLPLLAVPAVCGYASLVEPYDLKTESVSIPVTGMFANATPIRVVVLADIQTDRVSDYEKDWLAQANAQNADVIVLPGDFFPISQEPWDVARPKFVELLRSLEAKHGVYACMGNVDDLDQLRGICHEANVRLLENEVDVVNINGTRLAIGGTIYRPTKDARHEQTTMAKLQNANADIRLLLNHVPDGVLGAKPEYNVDLIVSGHTHGGQVVVPGFGPLITLSSLPREVAAGGLHEINGQSLYVSRGVGMERWPAPPIRLFCPPEMTILTFCAQ